MGGAFACICTRIVLGDAVKIGGPYREPVVLFGCGVVCDGIELFPVVKLLLEKRGGDAASERQEQEE